MPATLVQLKMIVWNGSNNKEVNKINMISLLILSIILIKKTKSFVIEFTLHALVIKLHKMKEKVEDQSGLTTSSPKEICFLHLATHSLL